MKPSSTLLEAYRRTQYCVPTSAGDLILRVGRPDPQADHQLREGLGISRHWHIITPCNPHSRRCSVHENQLRLQAFHAELERKKLRWYPSVNHDPNDAWPDEASVLLCDASDALAESLGREYQQNAIVKGQLGAAPELVWLRG